MVIDKEVIPGKRWHPTWFFFLLNRWLPMKTTCCFPLKLFKGFSSLCAVRVSMSKASQCLITCSFTTSFLSAHNEIVQLGIEIAHWELAATFNPNPYSYKEGRRRAADTSMRNRSRKKNILLQAILTCLCSKFRESYMPPAIRIRVKRDVIV
jgi:hypothetical protein